MAAPRMGPMVPQSLVAAWVPAEALQVRFSKWDEAMTRYARWCAVAQRTVRPWTVTHLR